MWKSSRAPMRLVILLALAAVSVWLAGTFYARFRDAALGLPIRSARHAAEKLLTDRHAGNFAIEAAVDYGNEVLPHLSELSGDFETINVMQAARLAEVLSRIPTPACADILGSLLVRSWDAMSSRGEGENQTNASWWEEDGVLQKCIGAFGLARQGKLTDIYTEDGFLIECVGGHTEAGKVPFSDVAQALCALALGYSGAEDAATVLCRQLPRFASDWTPLEIIDALAILGNRAAIGPLHELLTVCLKGNNVICTEGGSDLPMRVVRALLALGDAEVIGLLIPHVHPDFPRDCWLLKSLRASTGQDLGGNPDSWRNWWQGQRAVAKVSAEAMHLLRKEASEEKANWLVNAYTGGGLQSADYLSSIRRLGSVLEDGGI